MTRIGPGGFRVREATLADLGALHGIQAAGDLHERRLRPGGRSYHPENRVYLVEAEGEPVGYLYVVFWASGAGKTTMANHIPTRPDRLDGPYLDDGFLVNGKIFYGFTKAAF